MHNKPPPCALTIAGSDSCGGAGIQADLKTFGAWRVEGASAITAVTSQNTLGVDGVEVIGADLLGRQIDAVLDDLPIGAAKTGMLANAELIETVAKRWFVRERPPLVLDPVMVATSGARLLDTHAERVMIERLLPLATLVTPNLPEAAVLTGLAEDAGAEALIDALLERGARAVLLKGGHSDSDEIEDWLATAEARRCIRHPRIDRKVHGTGCALSAAITAGLARGVALPEAVPAAIDWLQGLIGSCWSPSRGELGMLPFADRGLDR